MPKLPRDVSAREVVRVLQRIGFSVDRQAGSHITLIRGNPFGRVTVPNHATIKPGMLKRIESAMAAINVYEYLKFLPTLQDILTGTLIEFLQDNSHWLVYLDASITRRFETVLGIAPRETRV